MENQADRGKKGGENGQKRIQLILTLVVAAALLVFYIIDPAGFQSAMSALFFEDEAAAPLTVDGAFRDGVLEVHFLDVGQGDSIFLRSPNGKTMLIDTGEAKYFEVIDSFLQAHEVARIDALVETHPHSDHMGGMAKVVEKYDVGVFYACPAENTTVAFEKLLDILEKKNVRTIVVYADQTASLPWDRDVNVRVLSPFSDETYDINNASIVLNIAFGDTSVLLMGDAEKPAERIMLARQPAGFFRANLLKLGHHGSSTSSDGAFFEAVAPEVVAIQLGAGNDYGHPHQEVLDLLAAWGGPVYRTDINGTIRFLLNGAGYTVATQR